MRKKCKLQQCTEEHRIETEEAKELDIFDIMELATKELEEIDENFLDGNLFLQDIIKYHEGFDLLNRHFNEVKSNPKQVIYYKGDNDKEEQPSDSILLNVYRYYSCKMNIKNLK